MCNVGGLHKTRGPPYDRIEVSEMPNHRSERPEMLIDSILPLHPRLSQDLFQMDAQIWAIHGYIPVDGEVILAEFEHRETARAVLAQLAAAQELSRSRRLGSV
jgi:hypothetical protein